MSKSKAIRERIIGLADFGVVWFYKSKFVWEFDCDERLVRDVISKLGKEDIKYFYMPVGKDGKYKKALLSSEQEINAFARTLLSTMATIYFNKYKPIKDLITDRKLERIMQQLDLALEDYERTEQDG